MAIIRYKGKTTVTTPTRSRGTSGSDASSARIASERASSGKTSMTGERSENAAQRKARLGIMDLPDGGVEQGVVPQAEPQVDTSQPSPQTAQVQPQGLVPYDQALKGIQATTPNKDELARTTQALDNVYKKGFQQTVAAGTADAKTAGEAGSVINNTLPPAKDDMSMVDQMVDDELAPVKQAYIDFFDPEEQKKSLFDYAKPYMKELEGLDEQIIDAQSIIDGTEDDIRNEIEMAGGFGSDSQVQALALARNKSLLKNYNNLVALRESKANQMNMMTDLADKDRTYALKKFDTMMGWAKFETEFRQKSIQNARDQYNKYTPQQLQAMLAGNPRQLAFAE